MKDEDGCLSDNEKLKRKFYRAISHIENDLMNAFYYTKDLEHIQQVTLQGLPDSSVGRSEAEGEELEGLPASVVSDLDFQRPEACRRHAGVFRFERRTYSLLVELGNLYQYLSRFVTAETMLQTSHSYCNDAHQVHVNRVE
jgi:hypothetical protein